MGRPFLPVERTQPCQQAIPELGHPFQVVLAGKKRDAPGLRTDTMGALLAGIPVTDFDGERDGVADLQIGHRLPVVPVEPLFAALVEYRLRQSDGLFGSEFHAVSDGRGREAVVVTAAHP